MQDKCRLILFHLFALNLTIICTMDKFYSGNNLFLHNFLSGKWSAFPINFRKRISPSKAEYPVQIIIIFPDGTPQLRLHR